MQYVMRRIFAVALVAALVVSCGGGGSSFVGIDRLGVTTGTITGFGSIIVNGVEYQTGNSTAYDIDDNPAGLASSLQVGQVVALRWSRSDNGVTRTAVEVKYDDAVEGPIATGSISLVTRSFVVLGQTVVVDADTSYASPLFDLGSLADGNFVQVSGLIDSGGVIRATRIERKNASVQLEIRGVVANRTGTTYSINGQVVNTATAVIDAPGGAVNNGDYVEAMGTILNGADELVATRVELEDGQSSVGESGEEAEVEGYVSSFTSNNSFSVNGIPVISSVTPTGGTLALNAKVKVEGTFNASGAIVASEVEVRTGASGSASTVRIDANVDSVSAAAGQFVVLGITVIVNANTRLEDQSAAAVRNFNLADLRGGGNPDFVEVRGVPQGNNTHVATLLQRQEPDFQGILRGPVGSLNNPSFTILGVTVQTDDFTLFEDDIDFFGGAVTVGDIVKVKFPNPPDSPILAEEVELED